MNCNQRCHNSSKHVDIALPHSQPDILVPNASLSTLKTFCGKEYQKRHWSKRPDGSMTITTLTADCDRRSLEALIYHMQLARDRKDTDILRHIKREDLLTACRMEEASIALGLGATASLLRQTLLKSLRAFVYPADVLQKAWSALSRGSYWSEQILDHFRRQRRSMQKRREVDPDFFCYYCRPRFMGPSVGESGGHNDPRCILLWYHADPSLRDSVGRYCNSRKPTLYTAFGRRCAMATRKRVTDWILNTNGSERPEQWKIFASGHCFHKMPHLRGIVHDKHQSSAEPPALLEGRDGNANESFALPTLLSNQNFNLGAMWLAARGYQSTSSKERRANVAPAEQISPGSEDSLPKLRPRRTYYNGLRGGASGPTHDQAERESIPQFEVTASK